MRRHYLVTIAPVHGSYTQTRLRPAWGRPRRLIVGPYYVTIYTPDGWPEPGLRLDLGDSRIRLVEGQLLPGGTAQPLRPGIYNEVVIDGAAQSAIIRNDIFATLPCYYWSDREELVLSNTLHLIAEYTNAAVDELALAQSFMFCGGILGGRTLFRDVWGALPGREYHFDLNAWNRLSVWRRSRMWTAIDQPPPEAAVEHLRDLWEQALDRATARLKEPVGVMLSGGLDSRLVAGGLASRGLDLVCLTHGNTEGEEAELARQVAGAIGARFVANPMDSSFDFGSLALPHLHHFIEGFHNPIWDSSARLLSGLGLRQFSTGVGLDLLLGGYHSNDRKERLADNLRLSLIGPGHAAPADEHGIARAAQLQIAQAERRVRGNVRLLAEPFRSLVQDSLEPTRRAVHDRMEAYAAESAVTWQQLKERFFFENRGRQVIALQERMLLHYGSLVAPSLDPDLATYLSNLAPTIRRDHYLYYPFIRRLYPRLARIPVSSLGMGAHHAQPVIELGRVARILGRRRLTTWVNFEPWLALGDNLDRYERLFVNSPHFFDVDMVRAHFAAVRDGKARLYDGNETLAFLSLAWWLRNQSSRVRTSSAFRAIPTLTRPTVGLAAD